ncbi:MAG: ribose-5-phosphate isomerase RpiA [SAR324 cluster bacterium]|nr:ribose-5-phosphate isomerase RpiA [SAR324 cluster bacterium]
MSEQKKRAAEKATESIKHGMILGLGTGSTAAYAVAKIGQMVRDGLSVKGIPTSEQTRVQAEAEGIPLIDFSETTTIDLTIDGADEIDGNFNMIKGGGGALFREKIVASASREVLIVTDASKRVACLGKFPLPVEVSPFGWQVVAGKLKRLGANDVKLRTRNQTATFISDNGNYILDCHFEQIRDVPLLEAQINQIPGVVVNGLFVNLATRLIIGTDQGVEVYER